MDVQSLLKTACLCLIALGLSSCSQKSTSTVFPDSNNKTSSACTGEQIKTRFIVAWEDGRVSVHSSENKDVFIENFVQPNLFLIKHVEFDRRVILTDQIRLVESGTSVDSPTWGQTITEAPAVWSQGVLGEGIKVAVVDAAVDYTHPQIATRLSKNVAEAEGADGKDDDGNGLVDDVYGWDFFGHKPQPKIDPANDHGTHVAGIILADHDTGSMLGMAPKAQLIPANFMDQAGGGSLGDAIVAMNYAVSRGARVINASWGGNFCSDSLKQTIAGLAAKNVLFVAAAGNDGVDLDLTPEFPAAFSLDAQLTVGATRSTDRLAGFSNTSFNLVNLAAPGDSIYSTVPGGYKYLSGTSMATPFVSGAAALLLSAKPQATVGQLKAALMNSVDVKDYRVMTRGRLNVRKALEEIKRLVP